MDMFDPISYCFFFHGITNEPADLRSVCLEFMHEFCPYILEWMDVVRQQKKNTPDSMWCGESMNLEYKKGKEVEFFPGRQRIPLFNNYWYNSSIKNHRDLHACQYPNTEAYVKAVLDAVNEKPFEQFSFTLMDDVLPQEYCVKVSENEYKRINDFLNVEALEDEESKKERVARLLLFPEPGLRGIGYPKKFFHKESLNIDIRALPLSFHKDMPAWDIYKNRVEYSKIYQDDDRNLIQIRICFPRMLLHGREFPFQTAWTERMRRLGTLYPTGIGMMDMDSMGPSLKEYLCFNQDMERNPFRPVLPGYAWGMLFTDYQIEASGGIEQLNRDHVFRTAEKLPTGSFYLQMTENMENVPEEKIIATAERFSSYMMGSKKWYAEWDCLPTYRTLVSKECITDDGYRRAAFKA